MLKSAEEKDSIELESFLSGGIVSLRILSYIKAYGFKRDFLKFWIGYDEKGIHAVVSLFEDSVLIKADKNADYGELKTFLSMLSFSSLSCEENVAKALSFKDYDIKQGYVFSGVPTHISAENIQEDSLKNVYRLICENIPGSFSNTKEAFLSFLSDFTFRERRGLARGKCIHENGVLVSCAVTSAETVSKALLSGVVADKAFKGKGYGRKVVLSLVDELLKECKTPYVIALNDSAKGFYEHIGFKKDSLIAYINRKD